MQNIAAGGDDGEKNDDLILMAEQIGAFTNNEHFCFISQCPMQNEMTMKCFAVLLLPRTISCNGR